MSTPGWPIIHVTPNFFSEWTEPNQPNPPFWKEEPEVQIISSRQFVIVRPLLMVWRITFLVILFALLFYLSPVWALFCLVMFLTSIGAGIYLRGKRKHEIQALAEIQQRAYQLTGASLIGSAVHVAGHPKLARDQKVLLALIASDLTVFSFETNQPLAIIPLQQIASIQTVVYDDEHIPHVEVIDSTAQALQLILTIGGYEIACLFRGMKNVRPIDWYHAIQKSRTQ